MSILITLLVYFVILGLVWWLISMLPLPSPINVIVQVIFVIFAIIMLLSLTGVMPMANLPQLR